MPLLPERTPGRKPQSQHQLPLSLARVPAFGVTEMLNLPCIASPGSGSAITLLLGCFSQSVVILEGSARVV